MFRQPFKVKLHNYHMKNKAALEEEKQIARALDGVEAAFKWLYDQYKNPHFVICLRYSSSKEEAEDMLQEGFIQIFNELNRFDSAKGSFYNWSVKVIINSCLQHIRKKKIVFTDIEDAGLQQRLADDYNAFAQLSLEETMAALQKMPDGYRTVFNLYHIEGYSHKEIAEMLGITESTSKTQLMKSKSYARYLLTNEIGIER